MENNNTDFRSLTSWQMAFKLSKHLYAITENWENKNLSDLILKAGITIPSKIAGGYAGIEGSLRRNYFKTAIHATFEVMNLAYLAMDLKQITLNEAEEIATKTVELRSMITSLSLHMDEEDMLNAICFYDDNSDDDDDQDDSEKWKELLPKS